MAGEILFFFHILQAKSWISSIWQTKSRTFNISIFGRASLELWIFGKVFPCKQGNLSANQVNLNHFYLYLGRINVISTDYVRSFLTLVLKKTNNILVARSFRKVSDKNIVRLLFLLFKCNTTHLFTFFKKWIIKKPYAQAIAFKLHPSSYLMCAFFVALLWIPFRGFDVLNLQIAIATKNRPKRREITFPIFVLSCCVGPKIQINYDVALTCVTMF